MVDVNHIIEHALSVVSRDLEQKEKLRTSLINWLHGQEILDYYLSENPDRKLSPWCSAVLSVLTEQGFHGVELKQDPTEDTYVFVPLKTIEWIRGYRPDLSNSYVIQLQIPKTVINISDFAVKRNELEQFAGRIREAIAGSE